METLCICNDNDLQTRNTQLLPTGLVFIDPAVDDYESLMAGVIPGLEVFLLDGTRDGVEQISDILSDWSGLSSLHIVSHGTPGSVQLGTGQLSIDTLNTYSYDLKLWRNALIDNAEILLYGCEVAKGEQGVAFIDRLSELTETRIAASKTKTGSAALGADWEFVETINLMAFSLSAISNYSGVLATTVVNGDFETGNLSGWTLANAPGSGSFFIQSGSSSPVSGFSVLPPPQGNYAAMADQTGPGSHVLYQDISIAAGSVSTLSFRFFVANRNGSFITPNTLSTSTANQQFRVDLLNPGLSNFFGTATDGVLANIFQTNVGSTTIFPSYQSLSYNLTPFAGSTVRLAFRSVETQYYFQVGVDDVTVNSSTANHSATISGTATASVTEDASSPNLTATGSLSVSDVDAGENKFSTTVTPVGSTLGSLSIADTGSFNYSVANSAVQYLGAGQTKVETFTVKSLDGTASQNINVTITGVNDAAAISGTATASVTEDASSPNLTATGSLSVSDVDAGENKFNTTVTPVGSTLGSLSITDTGSFNYSIANSAVQYLGAGQTKVESFTVKSLDASASQNINVTITGVNDTAIISGVATAAVTEDAGALLTATSSLTVSDADAGQSLFSTTVASAPGNLGSLTMDANGTYSYSVDNSAVQYLGAGQTKTETFTVSSVDASASQTVTVDIAGVNDTAIISGVATAAVTEDTGALLTATGSLTVSDADAGQSLFGTTVVSAPGNLGSLTMDTNGTYSYSVDNNAVQYLGAGQTKTETFTVSSVDGSANQNIDVTITGVNDAPIVTTPIATQTLAAYSLLNFAIPAGTFTDVDAVDATLSYTATLADGSALPSWLSFNPGTQSFQGIANSEDSSLSIKVTATDSSNVSVSSTFALNVVLPTTTTTNTITGTTFADQLQGLSSNDLINGLAGNDTLFGNVGDDTLNGETGNDILRGGIGNDILNGGADSDQLYGDEGNDILIGGAGVDTLRGSIGNDILDGGSANDLLFGDDGVDTLIGGSGDDTLKGGNDGDLLYGSAGNDFLYGDAGSDTFWGGLGNDSLWGGVGNDRFGLQSGQGSDTVRDFSIAEGDLFVLGSGLSFGSLGISQSGANTLIKLGTETLATLYGIQSTLITADLFVA